MDPKFEVVRNIGAVKNSIPKMPAAAGIAAESLDGVLKRLSSLKGGERYTNEIATILGTRPDNLGQEIKSGNLRFSVSTSPGESPTYLARIKDKNMLVELSGGVVKSTPLGVVQPTKNLQVAANHSSNSKFGFES